MVTLKNKISKTHILKFMCTTNVDKEVRAMPALTLTRCGVERRCIQFGLTSIVKTTINQNITHYYSCLLYTSRCV